MSVSLSLSCLVNDYHYVHEHLPSSADSAYTKACHPFKIPQLTSARPVGVILPATCTKYSKPYLGIWQLLHPCDAPSELP